MSETFSPPPQQTERIDDIAKAHEMAKAGDRLRTIAALDRTTAQLMRGLVEVGTTSTDITKALEQEPSVATEQAQQIKYANIGPNGGEARRDAEVADILENTIAPSMDAQAGKQEDAAAERYDAQNR